MSHLTVAPSGSHLRRNGSPFVMVADTAWSAFADAAPDEWRQYLRFRANQGFNTVLVSVLPILHDRAVREDAREPFVLDNTGHYRFDAPNSNYFAMAEQLAMIASEEGVTLGLVVLWRNYVGSTWSNEQTPWAIMSDPDRQNYISLVTRTFSQYDPVFIISGDEFFVDPGTTVVYRAALEQVKRESPSCLTTMHSVPTADLPAEIADSPALDFYSYQAGHHIDHQDRAHALAQLYLQKEVRRPIIDLEPCYEGHGYGSGAGRFRAHHVRNATWWSILGGASAGIGYGAHGIWQWYRRGAIFTSPEFSLEPFDRASALGFDGANDVGLAGALVRDHALFETRPRQELLLNPYPGVRAAATKDLHTIAAYLPDARDLDLAVELDQYRVSLWDLQHRTRLASRLAGIPGGTRLEQPGTLGDCLLIAEK